MHCVVLQILGGIDFNGKSSVVVIGEFDVWLNRVVMPPKLFRLPVILCYIFFIMDFTALLTSAFA